MEIKDILEEAVRIGNLICDDAMEDDHGLFWKTLTLNGKTNKVEPKRSPSIYDGSGGIILFLLELYKHTHERKFLDVCRKASNWIINYCRTQKLEPNFFIGKTGVAFVFLKLYELDNQQSFLDFARELVYSIDNEDGPSDLLTGKAGTLLGLLHYFSVTGDENVITKIQNVLNELIKKISHERNGVSWQSIGQNISNLCGFSHGVSGIAFALLELANVIDSKALKWVVDQSIRYENSCYDSIKCNWPDYRKNVPDVDADSLRHLLKNNKDQFFRVESNMLAWCHGAPGIGMARIRAYELIRKKNYLADARRSIEAVSSDSGGNSTKDVTFTLCHGKLGNAMLYIVANRILPNIVSREFIEKLIIECIDSTTILNNKRIYLSGYVNAGNQYDNSLFMGQAGIGYFLLKFINDDGFNVMSPSLPKINQRKSELLKCIMDTELYRILFSTVYPNTYFELKEINQTVSYESLMLKSNKDIRNLISKEHHGTYGTFLKESFTKTLAYRHRNKFLLKCQSHVFHNDSEAIKTVGWNENTTFYLNPNIYLFKHKKNSFYLLRVSVADVFQYPINEFCFDVFSSFKIESTSNNMEKCTLKFINDYGIVEFNEIEELKSKIRAQINAGINEGFLNTNNYPLIYA